MDLTPSLVLAMWAAGMAASAAVVVWWAVVGPGFARLIGAAVVLAGVAAAAAGAGTAAWVSAAAALAAVLAAATRPVTVGFFATSAVAMGIAAAGASPFLPAMTGALVLGGISAEMMLGHWYLVDPRLPRWALQALVAGAGAALVADFGALAGEGALRWAAADAVLGWAFVAMAALTALLLVGVSLALREPAYSGVMAATGLSYLAVLTSFGVVVVGRTLAF